MLILKAELRPSEERETQQEEETCAVILPVWKMSEFNAGERVNMFCLGSSSVSKGSHDTQPPHRLIF